MSNNNLESIGGKLIGYELWWTVPQGSIHHKDYLRAASGTTIPSYYLKDKLGRSECFNRATSASLATEISKSLGAEISFKKITVRDSYAKGILFSKQEGLKLTVQQIGMVSVTANPGYNATLTFRTDPRHYLESEHEAIMDCVMEKVSSSHDPDIYNRDDVVGVLIAFCREYGFSLRESGGIYFIPSSSQILLHDVKDFVVKCIPDAKIYLKKEYVLEDSELDIYREVFRSEILKDFVEIQKSYNDLTVRIDDQLTQKIPVQKRTANSWIESLKDFKLAQDRIRLFSESLNTSEKNMTNSLVKMRRQLTAKLEKCRIKIDVSLKDFESYVCEDDDEEEIPLPSLPISEPKKHRQPTPAILKAFEDATNFILEDN